MMYCIAGNDVYDGRIENVVRNEQGNSTRHALRDTHNRYRLTQAYCRHGEQMKEIIQGRWNTPVCAPSQDQVSFSQPYEDRDAEVSLRQEM
jgi:hypothetical protein